MSTGYPAFPTDTVEGNAGFFLPALWALSPGRRSPMTSQQQFRYIRRQLTIFRTHHITLTKQAVVVVCAVAFVLYAVFFTHVPPIHDFFHGLRHAMGILPCH
jgi:hypothetical protein